MGPVLWLLRPAPPVIFVDQHRRHPPAKRTCRKYHLCATQIPKGGGRIPTAWQTAAVQHYFLQMLTSTIYFRKIEKK
jgi:hypothetical protein